MGVNKQQKGIVSPAGPVETGPAGFLRFFIYQKQAGLWLRTGGGGGSRQAEGTGGEMPQTASTLP